MALRSSWNCSHLRSPGMLPSFACSKRECIRHCAAGSHTSASVAVNMAFEWLEWHKYRYFTPKVEGGVLWKGAGWCEPASACSD